MHLFWVVTLAGVLTLAACSPRMEHMVNHQYSAMLQLIYDENDKAAMHCTVFDSWESIFQELSHHPDANINVVKDEPLTEFVKLCNLVSGDLGSIPTNMFTFPGTKWCGLGNTAENFDDLGENWKTDKCCRAHDLCPQVLLSGHSANGLVNDGIGTVSNCLCDFLFHRCLQNNMDQVSETVGILYFNVIKMKCFKLEHPISRCVKYYGRSDRTCQEYVVDENKPKLYQFFDPRHFTGNGKGHFHSNRSKRSSFSNFH